MNFRPPNYDLDQSIVPAVFIPHQQWETLQALAKVTCEDGTEVSGYGLVEVVGNSIIVTEIIVPHQRVSSIEAQISAETAANALNEVIADGKDAAKLRLQWHTHLGQTQFSDTDLADFAEENGDWMIYMVLNASGDHKVMLYMYQVQPLDPVGLELDVVIGDPPISEAAMKAARALADERIERTAFGRLETGGRSIISSLTGRQPVGSSTS